MTLDDAKTLARQPPGWLAQSPAAFREAVLDRVTLHAYAAGETVHVEGDQPAGVNGVVAGALRVEVSATDGQTYLAHLLCPGAWVGEGPTLIGAPRPVTLVAAAPTTILRLSPTAMQDIVRRNPGDWRCFTQQLMGHLRIALGALADGMIQDHRARMAAILLRLAGLPPATAEPAENTRVELPVSQPDLAMMAALGRTTASRILGEFRRHGMVKLGYGRIVIVDAQALRAVLTRGFS